jgi:NAD(P)-dependent dehydrogenase (short-subunit alcohol dehydrogenase family)
MDDFNQKVAVITGGGGGLGKAIAMRCVQEGMRVVLAGINAQTLHAAEMELRERGGTVLSVPTDVSKWEDVQRLAEKTVERFDEVHLVVNNAGVYAGTTTWDTTRHDWQWVLDVNLWGTIYCLQAFVPILLKQPAGGHIVNVSSIAGLMTFPGWSPYKVTKASQIVISETLDEELKARGANVSVSVFLPGFIQTNIANASRNRPAALLETSRDESIEREIQEGVSNGLPPEAVMDALFEGIRSNEMYIFSHPGSRDAFQGHFERILESAGRIPAGEIPS